MRVGVARSESVPNGGVGLGTTGDLGHGGVLKNR